MFESGFVGVRDGRGCAVCVLWLSVWRLGGSRRGRGWRGRTWSVDVCRCEGGGIGGVEDGTIGCLWRVGMIVWVELVERAGEMERWRDGLDGRCCI